MAEMNGRGPDSLLGPSNRLVRARLDPAVALEGDETLVIGPDEDDDPQPAADGERPRVHLGPPSHDRAGVTHREVVVDGWRFVVATQSERLARLRDRASSGRASAAGGGRAEIRAVIPGRIVAVSVAVGDRVEAGQQILIVEAMKMQNEVRAPHAGEIERIEVAPGQAVEVGAILVVIV